VDENQIAQLRWLRCPRSGVGLRLASPEQLQQLRRLHAAGQLVDQAGTPLVELPENWLVSEQQGWIYPVLAGIPRLVAERAIAWPRLE